MNDKQVAFTDKKCFKKAAWARAITIAKVLECISVIKSKEPKFEICRFKVNTLIRWREKRNNIVRELELHVNLPTKISNFINIT